jgi:hypothetical protein
MAFNFFYYFLAVFIVILIISLLFLIKHYAITPLSSTEIILNRCLAAIAVVISLMPSCVLLCKTKYQVDAAAKSQSVPTLFITNQDEMPDTVYKLFHYDHILTKQEKLPDGTYKNKGEYQYTCKKCNFIRDCLYYQCEVTQDKFCAKCILDSW